MKPRALLSGLALLATLVALGYAFESGVFGTVLDERWIDRAVRGHGIAGELVYVGVAGVATAIAMPRQIVSFLGGYAFGFVLGSLLALAGTELGCLLGFFYARLVGRPLLGTRLRPRVQRFDRFLATHPFAMTLLVRLLPIGNNALTNLAAGLSRVNAVPFLLGSLVGYLPQTIVFALAGSGVQVDASPRIALAALLFALSVVIGWRLYRRHHRPGTPDDEIGEAVPPTVAAISVVHRDRPLLLLVGGWMAFAIASIWLRPLWPVDETRYASVAWDMWQRGNLLVPYVNGEAYSHKPPLLFWLMHAGWAVFGVNEWWPRMVAPLCALAAAPLLVRMRRLMWNDGEATLLPVWVLYGTLLFAVFVTLTMFDLLLMVCAMVALVGVLRLAHGERRAGIAWLGIGIGLGVLAKGPVILLHVLPVALVAPWWAPQTRASPAKWYGGIVLGVLLGAAIALAWAIPAAISGGEAYARAIFWGQTAGRVSESFAHRAPWWYYVPLLPVMFFPWLAWPPFWRGARALVRDRAGGTRFAAAWLALTLIAFSLVSGKQAKYLVPVLPAVALLVARALSHPRATVRRFDFVLPALGFIGGAMGLAVARAIPDRFDLPLWADAIAPWPIVALVAVGVALLLVSRAPTRVQVRAMSAAMLAGAFALGGLVPALVPYNDVRPVAVRIAALQSQGIPVAFFGKYHAQFNFVGRLAQPVDIVDDADLGDWVVRHADGIVIETEREQHHRGPGGPDLEEPFRGGFITLWKGDNLLAHHRSEQQQ